MMQIVPDTPLSADELLLLTPKEAALLTAMRDLFQAIEVDIRAVTGRKAVITEQNYDKFLSAKGLYLKLRNRSAGRDRSD